MESDGSNGGGVRGAVGGEPDCRIWGAAVGLEVLECDRSLLSRVRGRFESGFGADARNESGSHGRGDEVPA